MGHFIRECFFRFCSKLMHWILYSGVHALSLILLTNIFCPMLDTVDSERYYCMDVISSCVDRSSGCCPQVPLIYCRTSWDWAGAFFIHTPVKDPKYSYLPWNFWLSYPPWNFCLPTWEAQKIQPGNSVCISLLKFSEVLNRWVQIKNETAHYIYCTAMHPYHY